MSRDKKTSIWAGLVLTTLLGVAALFIGLSVSVFWLHGGYQPEPALVNKILVSLILLIPVSLVIGILRLIVVYEGKIEGLEDGDRSHS